MLINAFRAEGIQIAAGRTYYGSIVVNPPLFPRLDSAEVVALGLQILLGCTNFIFDQDADSATVLEDPKKKICFAVGVGKAVPRTVTGNAKEANLAAEPSHESI